MKTEVVLKLVIFIPIHAFPLFNENRSCIEIKIKEVFTDEQIMFNENRSCIEMIRLPILWQFSIRLMKTEVVLKFVMNNPNIPT